MGKHRVWDSTKKYLGYCAEAIAIAGMAFGAGILSVHLQRLGNMFISQSSWEEKMASIAQYWYESYKGICIMIAVFILFLVIYLVVRGRSDKPSEKMLDELKAINKKLDKILPNDDTPTTPKHKDNGKKKPKR
jgi:hypothetical protein